MRQRKIFDRFWVCFACVRECSQVGLTTDFSYHARDGNRDKQDETFTLPPFCHCCSLRPGASQMANCKRTSKVCSLLPIRRQTMRLQVKPTIAELQYGFSRAGYLQRGKHQDLCCGSMGNVRCLSIIDARLVLIASWSRSRLWEEHSYVRHHLPSSPNGTHAVD